MVEIDVGGGGGEISEVSVVRRVDYLPEDAAFGGSDHNGEPDAPRWDGRPAA